MEGCTSPPSTCLIETVEDEQKATELGETGLEVLSLADRARVGTLWETAKDAAKQLDDFPIDGAADAFLNMFEGRVPLITTAEELQRARVAVTRLVATMVHDAQIRSQHAVNPFSLTDALFKNFPLFPFTD